MKKLFRYGRIVRVDVLIYAMDADHFARFPETGFAIDAAPMPDGRTHYFVTDSGRRIHSSYLFPSLRLLRTIGKRGPAIGDCVTDSAYKGRSIYPFVINRIAETQFNAGKKEVFMVVNRDNTASIRGIEKAGFRLRASVKGRRFLWWFLQLTKEEF